MEAQKKGPSDGAPPAAVAAAGAGAGAAAGTENNVAKQREASVQVAATRVTGGKWANDE